MEKTKLKTKPSDKISFRSPKLGDAEALLEFINKLSSEQTFVMAQGEQKTLEEENKWLKDHLEEIEKSKSAMLLAFSNNYLVGTSQIKMKNRVQAHVGILGISVSKDFRGKGIGKMLMEEVIKETKKKIPALKIVTLSVFANNLIGINLYKKLGFKEWGRFPGSIFYKGEYVDEIWMYKNV